MNLDKVGDHAWGAATLAYLYHQLGKASRFEARQICGCLTLIQVNIILTFSYSTRKLFPIL